MSDTFRLVRFGVFELNLDLEEIRKNGMPLKLPPQPFKLLALLAIRSGQVVTRDEIQQQLWGNDTFIDFEQGVNKCVKQIRTALNDNADRPLYLETIPRRGYRFLAPVRTKTVPAPPPQVREASSALMGDVASQVRARIEAASAAGMPAGSQQDADGKTEVQTQELPSVPQLPARNRRARLLPGAIPLAIVLAALLCWFLWQTLR